MSKITYSDKSAINVNASIPEANKVTDANMNDIKGAINQVGSFNTLTPGSNGDYYTTLKGTLATGDIITAYFPSATVGASNARLSVTGSGGTYINIKSKGQYQLLGSEVGLKYLELYYDGTQFIVKEINDIGKKIRVGKTSNQAVTITTSTLITFQSTVSNQTKGLSLSSNRVYIGKGISSIFVIAQYQENTTSTVEKYIYIRKNGAVVASRVIQNQSNIYTEVAIPVVEGDYIEISCYMSAGGTIQSSSVWTYFDVIVLS